MHAYILRRHWHIFHNNGHEFVYSLFLTFESKPKSNRMSVVLCCVVLMTMVFSIRLGTKNWGYQSKHFHWGYLKYLGVPEIFGGTFIPITYHAVWIVWIFCALKPVGTLLMLYQYSFVVNRIICCIESQDFRPNFVRNVRILSKKKYWTPCMMQVSVTCALYQILSIFFVSDAL